MCLNLLVCVEGVEHIGSVDQFRSICNGDEYVVIKYYTNWCSHCKRLAPVYNELEQIHDNMRFLEVDCDELPYLCNKLPGYPIVQVIKPLEVHQKKSNQNTTSESTYKAWYNRIFGWSKPVIEYERDRAIEYRGQRSRDSISNFLDTLRHKHELERAARSLIRNYGDEIPEIALEVRKIYEQILLPLRDSTTKLQAQLGIIESDSGPHRALLREIVYQMLDRVKPTDEL